ncbi:hypothetical protein [Pedobacter sp.]
MKGLGKGIKEFKARQEEEKNKVPKEA